MLPIRQFVGAIPPIHSSVALLSSFHLVSLPKEAAISCSEVEQIIHTFHFAGRNVIGAA